MEVGQEKQMSLEDQLNEENAPAWRPEEGDVIQGKVVNIDLRPAGDYPAYWIITLEKADGEREAIHAFHSVLAQELQRIRPQVGHMIAVKYLGKKQGRNYSYANYKAATEHKPEVDWGTAPAEQQQEQLGSDIPSDDFATAQTMTSPNAAKDDDDIPF
jgi:hypothetical protein